MEKSRKRKHFKGIVTIDKVDDEMLNTLRNIGEGKTVLLVKGLGVNERTLFEDRWRAVEEALRIKRENPNLTVKLIIY